MAYITILLFTHILNYKWHLQWCCWHQHVGDMKLSPTSITVVDQNVCKPPQENASRSIQDSKERWDAFSSMSNTVWVIQYESYCMTFLYLTLFQSFRLSRPIMMNSTVKVKPVSDLRKFIMKEIIRLTLNGNSRI